MFRMETFLWRPVYFFANQFPSEKGHTLTNRWIAHKGEQYFSFLSKAVFGRSREQNRVLTELRSLKVHPFSLTQCRLNELSHTLYWKILISIFGMSGCVIWTFLEKNCWPFYKQWRPWSDAAFCGVWSGLHCLPITLLGVSILHTTMG